MGKDSPMLECPHCMFSCFAPEALATHMSRIHGLTKAAPQPKPAAKPPSLPDFDRDYARRKKRRDD